MVDRRTVTSAVKALGGEIFSFGKTWAVYLLPITEEKFLQFRAGIPFLTCWHGTVKGKQSVAVFFDNIRV